MATKKAVQRKKKSNNNLKTAPKPASQDQPVPDSSDEPVAEQSCKQSGRKARVRISNSEDIDLDPGAAGSNLRHAINSAVASQSGRIASALIQGTIQGNIGSARLLIEISGARNPEPKKRIGLSWAEQVAREPQWVGPPDYGDDDEEKDDEDDDAEDETDIDVNIGGREPQL